MLVQNPRLQVCGDSAILTCNFAGVRRAADAKINASLARPNRVYAKMDGQWKLVHSNYAPVMVAG